MDRPILAQIEEVYYSVLAVFGVPVPGSGVRSQQKHVPRFNSAERSENGVYFAANLLAIVTLSRGRCGLSKCISRYLLAMAVADLMVITFDVVLHEMKEVYFPGSLLDHTPLCSLILALIPHAVDCSVWLTVAFTFDRVIAICYQKIRAKYCTEKTAAMVIMLVCLLSFLLNIPVYFMIEPGEVIDDKPMFCAVKSAFFTLPSWVTYYWFRTTLTPFAPFVLIALLNALTIRHITRATRVRRQLLGSRKGGSQSDAEVENRRKSIVLLLAISSSFILLWAIDFLYEICVQVTDIQWFQTDYTDPFTVMERVGYMFQRLSSCTNTIIYAVAQTKFRAEMLMLIKSPFALLTKLIKRYQQD
ncbi:probable G-protein coupled receptor 139 [Pristis pectinata]|uniref:probable G-protein coupled receptor 139 n=1 Tax=Pristis pectinata TaxID=685728 RepID=UPI00223E46FD|nr:probable G-protein coupled receptor 139 [Pristis pectinata]